MHDLPPDDVADNFAPKEQTTESYLWGAQSARRLPCKPEIVDVSDRTAWHQPANEDIGENTSTSVFHSLLCQVELQYRRDLCLTRAELERKLEGFRSGVDVVRNWNQVPSENAEAEELADLTEPSCTPRHFSSTETPATPTPPVSVVLSPSFDRQESPDYGGFLHEASASNIENVQAKLKSVQGSRSNVTERVRSYISEHTNEDRVSAFNQQLRTVVNSSPFDGVCAAAIILNAALLGITTDIAAKNTNPDNLPQFFTYMDRLFTCWFLLELSLRLIADGLWRFCLGQNWSWNIFDSLVVTTDLVETSASFLSGGGSPLQNLTAFRMLRVLRIVRALRVIKLVHFFKELRMMVFSVLRSGLSLLWSMIMLVIIIFIFSVYLTQNATFFLYYDAHYEDAVTVKLRGYFGSLRMAGYMLFQCISGGISWGEVGEPLLEIHWSNGLVLCFYVFFTVFAVLNIITGIFVDTALNSAQTDRDEMIQEAVHSENSSVFQLQKFFMAADLDKSGTITLDELTEHLQNQRVRAHLATLGLEVDDATGIFFLLDLDKSGHVTIEEFIFGCLKMKGLARSIDLVSLLHESRRLKASIHQFFTFAKEKLKRGQEFQERMESLFFLQPHVPRSKPRVLNGKESGSTPRTESGSGKESV